VTARIADTPHLWAIIAREGWRRLRVSLRSRPVALWRFTGLAPDRLLIAPPDLRVPDPHFAEDFYNSRFLLANIMVDTGGRSPFDITDADENWLHALHNFRWLRHLRATNSELHHANARAMTGDWIDSHGRRLRGAAWEPEITAERIISWLQHSQVILKGAELPFYRNFVRMIMVQVRYLRSMAADMPRAEGRLRARIALAFASLSLPVSSRVRAQAARQLELELRRQILPDGGHTSRNPVALVELLSDLLPLRQTYVNQTGQPPPELVSAIDRMLPALRGLRHDDGALALFNGAGATAPERVMAVLRLDETAARPLLHGAHCGYQRLAMGGTCVIADTGTPPPQADSSAAQAGCLAIEMSSGRQRYIVNAGIDYAGPKDYRQLARMSAAHSTLVLNDTSSSRFSSKGWLSKWLGTPLVAGPTKVPVQRDDTDGVQSFTASHNGYAAPFGLIHERTVTLGQEGSVLSGTDRLTRKNGRPVTQDSKDRVCIRFHVHPSVQIGRDEEGRYALYVDSGDVWLFVCDDVAPQLAESVHFAGLAGPVVSRQIVLEYLARDFSEVHWQFVRTHLGRWSNEQH
jgi:uncharacterized heparinase superfamily protein